MINRTVVEYRLSLTRESDVKGARLGDNCNENEQEKLT